jgi:hypothetical protein
MDASTAYRAFCHLAIGAVNQTDHDTAFWRTVEELLRDAPRRTAKAYAAACGEAARLLRLWYADAAVEKPNFSAQYVISHRIGGTWAKFLRWEHEAAAKRRTVSRTRRGK